MNKYLILPALMFAPSLLAQSIERQHGVHEHGHATLNLAVSSHELHVQLETPAMNILGFEHAASSEQDREKLHQAVAQLQHPLKLITPNAEAECEVEKKTIHSALLEDKHDHDEHEKEHKQEKDHDHEAHEEEHEHEMEHDHENEQHADFDIEIEYHCENPQRLSSIETSGLFKTFPGFEDLDVQWITDATQGGSELNPGSTRIKLR